jgi:hypothetical protein
MQSSPQFVHHTRHSYESGTLVLNQERLLLTSKIEEKKQFASRLKQAIDAKGLRNSPTEIANLFNGLYQGNPVTPHTTRNWLMGSSLPTHEKMVCLGNLLGTSPEQLRYGRSTEMTFVLDGHKPSAEDQQFFKQYLNLNTVQQRLIRELVSQIKA